MKIVFSSKEEFLVVRKLFTSVFSSGKQAFFARVSVLPTATGWLKAWAPQAWLIDGLALAPISPVTSFVTPYCSYRLDCRWYRSLDEQS